MRAAAYFALPAFYEEKRRRAGEALVGPQRVYFLDEVTTGLDSATAQAVVSALADLAHLESVRGPGWGVGYRDDAAAVGEAAPLRGQECQRGAPESVRHEMSASCAR